MPRASDLRSPPDAEDFRSLSGLHDYEPNLEFDDSELLRSHDSGSTEMFLMDSTSTQDALMEDDFEENFEEQLAMPPVDPDLLLTPYEEQMFNDLNNSGLVHVVGDDIGGRRIVIISAICLPKRANLNQDLLLKYLQVTLNLYVEQDYSIVYFHYGLSNENKPSLGWFWRAYKAFDRRYKKNLKSLYVVHPTSFVKIVMQMLKPVISIKFGRKIQYLTCLEELDKHISLRYLVIPSEVKRYDEKLEKPRKPVEPAASEPSKASASSSKAEPEPSSEREVRELSPPHSQQFGVSLDFILQNNEKAIDGIPPIVQQCVEFLSQPEALETEGLFRRSANINEIQLCKIKSNKGERVSFDGSPNRAAVLLKNFLRELEEPLLTFALYEEIIEFPYLITAEKPRKVNIWIHERLPEENYKLLKYLMKFIFLVQDRSHLNKMTASNLAIVIGPNLIWPRNGQVSLDAVLAINAFTEYLIKNQDKIFIF